MAIRSDGRRLATASWDHTVMVWDLEPEFHPIVSARDGSFPKVAFDPGGLRIAVSRADGSLSVVDVQTEAVACAARSATAVQRLAWATSEQLAVVRPEGKEMVRSEGKEIELWSARRCAVEAKLVHPAPIDAMSTQARSRLVTAAGGIVRVWRRGQVEASFAGYPGRIKAVGIDGDDVYAITAQPAVIVVDAIEDPARRRIFRAGDRDITGLHFDRTRGQVVAASADQYVYIWDAATGMLARKLEGSGPLMAVRTSADGALTIGVGGHSPVVWNRASGEKIGQLEGHSAPVQDGEFIDDRLFVSMAADHTALVWDVAAARPLTAFHDVAAMVFAADRRTVAFVGATGVRVWSPRAPVPDLEALRALRVK